MNLTFRIASSLVERARERCLVASGPFKGAKPVPSALEHDWNKLMGLYEFYLHSAIESAIASRPPLCIDVGASEGYYTLGLAHRLPQSRHIAYEMDDKTRITLERSTASLKAYVQIKGICSTQDLIVDISSSERGFLLMDCEGGEESLLSPTTCDHLTGWHVLVEVHDFQAPKAGDKILNLLSPTHNVEIINSRQVDPISLASIAPWPLSTLCLDAFRTMLEEGRGCTMRFFYFTPKHSILEF